MENLILILGISLPSLAILVMLIALGITALGMIRNNFTYWARTIAIDAVYNYVEHLNINTYTASHYDKMIREYDDIFKDILNWKKTAGINPEYIEELKPYL